MALLGAAGGPRPLASNQRKLGPFNHDWGIGPGGTGAPTISMPPPAARPSGGGGGAPTGSPSGMNFWGGGSPIAPQGSAGTGGQSGSSPLAPPTAPQAQTPQDAMFEPSPTLFDIGQPVHANPALGHRMGASPESGGPMGNKPLEALLNLFRYR